MLPTGEAPDTENADTSGTSNPDNVTTQTKTPNSSGSSDNVTSPEISTPVTTKSPAVTTFSPGTQVTKTPVADTSSFTKEKYTNSNNESLQYWLYKPKNISGQMPLIIYLHGGSGKGDNLDLITSVDDKY